VDVRPLVVADTEASKPIEPGKGPLDDPSGTRDPKRVVGHLVAVVEESARRVRQDPTTDPEVTPRPYAVHATSPTRIRFRRFCYA
jgi:hypothetical protein